MTTDEFKIAINNNNLLKQERMTVSDQSLNSHEIEMIELANKNQNSHFGGVFERGREIYNFTGDTLVVGGGKIAGMRGENDGKTVLIDNKTKELEINELIANLSSGKWTSDPYTGEIFKTYIEKKSYIQKLKRKKFIYKAAFTEKNKDILNRYYTLNIENAVRPDMLASIISESDTSSIPDKKFMHIEFENVPCEVFLNPKLYPILERITKPGGTIKLSVSYVCRRLIVPVVQATNFSEEFTEKIKAVVYNDIKKNDLTYGSYQIELSRRI